MLSMLGREGVGEEKAAVSKVGEPQTMFTIQALHFAERARGICGGR